MKYDLKICAASPKIRLCDTEYNAALYIEAAKRAAKEGARAVLFPELALTGATAGDLFLLPTLTDGAMAALSRFAAETAELDLISFIGLPVRVGAEVYNAVAAVAGGEIVGISAAEGKNQFSTLYAKKTVNICGKPVTMSADALYSCDNSGGRVKIFVEIGLANSPVPKGADIILNPTAEPEYIGRRAERRREIIKKSAVLGVGYISCGASAGESGTDGVYASWRIGASRGKILNESELFSDDLFTVTISSEDEAVKYEGAPEGAPVRFPFIPEDKGELELGLVIAARGLADRMERARIKTAVLGVSGGLDSTLALLTAARAMDLLGRGRENIIAITMPCFGTSERTKSNALKLADELGCTAMTIDIKRAVGVHFDDIGHEHDNYDVVYENAQARERTQILMDVANARGGLVVGTGDLSELALGFATYGGDHLSMYGVNASIPKTLMRAMIRYAAARYAVEGKESLAAVLLDVVNTPVSPELLPTEDGKENGQHTEIIVGPYELHDFYLYCTVALHYSPEMTLAAAKAAFGDDYSEAEIRNYLGIFISRFFAQQFKRSCMPDGPRVTKISLSPRGAWQMPSDCSGVLFKKALG